MSVLRLMDGPIHTICLSHEFLSLLGFNGKLMVCASESDPNMSSLSNDCSSDNVLSSESENRTRSLGLSQRCRRRRILHIIAERLSAPPGFRREPVVCVTLELAGSFPLNVEGYMMQQSICVYATRITTIAVDLYNVTNTLFRCAVSP